MSLRRVYLPAPRVIELCNENEDREIVDDEIQYVDSD